MRYFREIFLASVLFSLSAVLVLAHGVEDKSPRETLMRQMMGDKTVEAMEQMEESMMGAENHERMEGLADKMFAGTISSAEQEEMIGLMRDVSAGPGAMNMMTRMMVPQMMQNSRILNYGMMGYGLSGLGWVFWVTVILVWMTLVLAIIVFWRRINRIND